MIAGVVAALAAEARALGRPVRRDGDGTAVLGDGTLVAVSGIGGAAAERTALRLIAGGAAALVSWGVAGALDPALAPGALCLPSEVIAAHGVRYPTSPRWREWLDARICARIGAASRPAGGALLTSERSIDGAAGKAEALRSSGAVAVDMESGAVARVAALHGLPFLAVRAILDAADDEVPHAVSAASQAGEVRMGRLLRGLARAPSEIVPLLRLARRYRCATHALAAVAGLGPLMPPDPGGDAGAGLA